MGVRNTSRFRIYFDLNAETEAQVVEKLERIKHRQNRHTTRALPSAADVASLSATKSVLGVEFGAQSLRRTSLWRSL